MSLSKLPGYTERALARPSAACSYILPKLIIHRDTGAYPSADYNSWKGYKVLAKGIELKSTKQVSVQLHASQTEVIFNQIQPYVLSCHKVDTGCIWDLHGCKPLLAQKQSDGYWYRALFIKEDGGKVTAKLVDTGDTVVCTKKQVMMCPMQFKHYVPGVVTGKITGFNGRESAAEISALRELVCGKDISIVIDAAESSGLMFSIYGLDMAPLFLLLEKKMMNHSHRLPLAEVKPCSSCGRVETKVQPSHVLPTGLISQCTRDASNKSFRIKFHLLPGPLDALMDGDSMAQYTKAGLGLKQIEINKMCSVDDVQSKLEVAYPKLKNGDFFLMGYRIGPERGKEHFVKIWERPGVAPVGIMQEWRNTIVYIRPNNTLYAVMQNQPELEKDENDGEEMCIPVQVNPPRCQAHDILNSIIYRVSGVNFENVRGIIMNYLTINAEDENKMKTLLTAWTGKDYVPAEPLTVIEDNDIEGIFFTMYGNILLINPKIDYPMFEAILSGEEGSFNQL